MRSLLTKAWSPTELDRFAQMVKDGASVTRCTAAFGRSSSSIKTQARKLGLALEGIRTVKAKQKAQIDAAEKRLPRGYQRFDGSRI